MTFDQVVNSVYGEMTFQPLVTDFDEGKAIGMNEVYLVNWGKCKQYREYSSETLSISLEEKDIGDDEYCVLVTDPGLSLPYNVAHFFTKGKNL